MIVNRDSSRRWSMGIFGLVVVIGGIVMIAGAIGFVIWYIRN